MFASRVRCYNFRSGRMEYSIRRSIVTNCAVLTIDWQAQHMVRWCRVLVLPSQESISSWCCYRWQQPVNKQLLPAPRHSDGLEVAVSRHLRPGEQKTAAGKWWPAPECQPNDFSARMADLHSLASTHLLVAWTRAKSRGYNIIIYNSLHHGQGSFPDTKSWYMIHSAFTSFTCIHNSANCVWSLAGAAVWARASNKGS